MHKLQAIALGSMLALSGCQQEQQQQEQISVTHTVASPELKASAQNEAQQREIQERIINPAQKISLHFAKKCLQVIATGHSTGLSAAVEGPGGRTGLRSSFMTDTIFSGTSESTTSCMITEFPGFGGESTLQADVHESVWIKEAGGSKTSSGGNGTSLSIITTTNPKNGEETQIVILEQGRDTYKASFATRQSCEVKEYRTLAAQSAPAIACAALEQIAATTINELHEKMVEHGKQ